MYLGLRIMAVCGNGMGSSMMVALNAKSILDKNKVAYDDCSNTAIGAFDPNNVDLVLAAQDIADVLEFDKSKIIVLHNLLSKEELETKLNEKLHFKK